MQTQSAAGDCVCDLGRGFSLRPRLAALGLGVLGDAGDCLGGGIKIADTAVVK